MMKVWILHHLDYGDISVWSEDTDPTQIKLVADELSYLNDDEYLEEERDQFISDCKRAAERGFGDAEIMDRLSIELTEVRTQ